MTFTCIGWLCSSCRGVNSAAAIQCIRCSHIAPLNHHGKEHCKHRASCPRTSSRFSFEKTYIRTSCGTLQDYWSAVQFLVVLLVCWNERLTRLGSEFFRHSALWRVAKWIFLSLAWSQETSEFSYSCGKSRWNLKVWFQIHWILVSLERPPTSSIEWNPRLWTCRCDFFSCEVQVVKYKWNSTHNCLDILPWRTSFQPHWKSGDFADILSWAAKRTADTVESATRSLFRLHIYIILKYMCALDCNQNVAAFGAVVLHPQLFSDINRRLYTCSSFQGLKLWCELKRLNEYYLVTDEAYWSNSWSIRQTSDRHEKHTQVVSQYSEKTKSHFLSFCAKPHVEHWPHSVDLRARHGHMQGTLVRARWCACGEKFETERDNLSQLLRFKQFLGGRVLLPFVCIQNAFTILSRTLNPIF